MSIVHRMDQVARVERISIGGVGRKTEEAAKTLGEKYHPKRRGPYKRGVTEDFLETSGVCFSFFFPCNRRAVHSKCTDSNGTTHP